MCTGHSIQKKYESSWLVATTCQGDFVNWEPEPLIYVPLMRGRREAVPQKAQYATRYGQRSPDCETAPKLPSVAMLLVLDPFTGRSVRNTISACNYIPIAPPYFLQF